jgi:hypothetical protein
MATRDLIATFAQNVRIEGSTNSQSNGNIIEIAPRFKLVQKPEALLGK